MEMRIESRQLGDVVVVLPQVFEDERGFLGRPFALINLKGWVCRACSFKKIIRVRRKTSYEGCIFSGTPQWES